MAIYVVNIELSDKNTTIVKDPQPFNIEIEVDLKDIWEHLIEEDGANNYIYIQTQIVIPTIYNGILSEVDLAITNYFKVTEIVDKKAMQYGYYEGDYDETRKSISSSKVWKYMMVAIGEEEKNEFFN